MPCAANRTIRSNKADQAATIISEKETSVSLLNNISRNVGPAPFRRIRQAHRRQAQGPEPFRQAQGPERVEGRVEGLAAGPRFAWQMVRRQAATLPPTAWIGKNHRECGG